MMLLGGTPDECVPYASEFADHLNGLGDPPKWWPYGQEFPDWHVWEGVSGILYARRPRSSPPKVVRSTEGAEGLRHEIGLRDAPR